VLIVVRLLRGSIYGAVAAAAAAAAVLSDGAYTFEHEQASTVLFATQFKYLFTLEYTPGRFAWAHPSPQETTPGKRETSRKTHTIRTTFQYDFAGP